MDLFFFNNSDSTSRGNNSLNKHKNVMSFLMKKDFMIGVNLEIPRSGYTLLTLTDTL